MQITCRPNIREADVTYTLNDLGLAVSTAGGHQLVPIDSIRSVRLTTTAARRMQYFWCHIETAQQTYAVTNIRWTNLLQYADDREGYRRFVDALHARLGSQPGVQFLRGPTRREYIGQAIVCSLIGLAIAVVPWFRATKGPSDLIVNAVIALLGVGILSYGVLHRPGVYAPTALPALELP